MSVTTQSGSVIYGRSEGARLGYALSTAGDINGDGFDDLILGAPNATPRDDDGNVLLLQAGEAILLAGRAGGFAPIVDLATAVAADPLIDVFDGTQSFATFGSAVAGGGDIDGDGHDDLLIGAPSADLDGIVDAGRSFVLYGSDEDPDGWQNGTPGSTSTVHQLGGTSLRSFTGFSVAIVNDLNGDGIADATIGTPGGNFGTRFGAGSVDILLSGGLDRDLDPFDGTAGRVTIHGAAALDYAGAMVSSAGDFNGDGFGDLLIGAPGLDANGSAAGGAYVLYGDAEGWQAEIDLATLDTSRRVRLDGALAGDRAGVVVAAAGDVNGDGYDDIVIATPDALGTGAAYVVFGSASGHPEQIDLGTLDGTNGYVIQGAFDGDRFGTSAAGVGDVNGDGFDDLLIGAPGRDSGSRFDAGAAYLLFGSGNSAGPVLPVGAGLGGRVLTFEGQGLFDNAGITVSGAGDVNGDGFGDFMIGADAVNHAGLVDAGAVYIVHGGGGLLAALDALDGLSDGTVALTNVGADVTFQPSQPPSSSGSDGPTGSGGPGEFDLTDYSVPSPLGGSGGASEPYEPSPLGPSSGGSDQSVLKTEAVPEVWETAPAIKPNATGAAEPTDLDVVMARIRSDMNDTLLFADTAHASAHRSDRSAFEAEIAARTATEMGPWLTQPLRNETDAFTGPDPGEAMEDPLWSSEPGLAVDRFDWI